MSKPLATIARCVALASLVLIPSAAAEALGCDAGSLDAVLGKCRRLDPAGVFARSLEECLAIQLDRQGRLDGACRVLLDNLDLVADREMARLSRLSGLDEAELLRRMQEIRNLDPRPGAAFGHDVVPAVVPDVVVDRAAGRWRIGLNDDLLPALAVSRQEPFLEHGLSHLRPLTLRTVAGAMGVHESTVGRAVANKYLATACGVFPMRSLFAGGFRCDAGERSAAAVRSRIRAIVESETPAAVVSDGRIAAILQQDGIRIARRTVAKYRDAMRIPPSALRRRRKRVIAAGPPRVGDI